MASGAVSSGRSQIKLAAAFANSGKYPQFLIHSVSQDNSGGQESIYITHLEHKWINRGTALVVCALSDFSLKLYQIEKGSAILKPIGRLVGHQSTITDICFGGPGMEKVVCSSSDDGTVRTWDFSTGRELAVLQAGLPAHYKPRRLKPTTFNACAAQKNIVVGAATDGNVYLWDAKNGKVLSVVQEYHQSEVLLCRFHPSSQNVLVTADQDGLINIFDLDKLGPAESEEKSDDDDDDDDDYVDDLDDDFEEALISVLNCEQSVRRLGFFGPHDRFLYVLTRIETLQFWDPIHKDNQRINDFGKLREQLSRQCGTSITSLVDCHLLGDRLILVCGNSSGAILLAHATAQKVVPFGLCPGTPEAEKPEFGETSHTSDIRCSAWLDGVLLTAGHDSKLIVWRPQ